MVLPGVFQPGHIEDIWCIECEFFRDSAPYRIPIRWIGEPFGIGCQKGDRDLLGRNFGKPHDIVLGEVAYCQHMIESGNQTGEDLPIEYPMDQIVFPRHMQDCHVMYGSDSRTGRTA